MSKNKEVLFTADERAKISAKIKAAGSSDAGVASAARQEFAQAIELPLRKVILSGNIINGIYTPTKFDPSVRVEYPLDLLVAGQEREFYAYTIPQTGRIPERRVEADYLMVPTYYIGNSIDCSLRFIRDANWPVVSRMMEVLEAGFVKKMNDDGWQTILAAATDRNLLINDPNAAAGQFTPRLVTLMKSFMRRNGGGNSASLNRSKLTHLFVSPEAHDDIRSWDLSLIPDAARENIYYADDNGGDLIKIYGVEVVALDEFGEGQEYQLYFSSTLSGTMASSDLEIAVGIDRQRDDSFVMPVVEEVQVFEDNTMHRRNLFGLYGRAELGFAVLDSRRTLLGSM